MTADGVDFYRADKLFGKLYNEQLYLLYKTDQLTQVLPEDMNNLQLILSVAYLGPVLRTRLFGTLVLKFVNIRHIL